MNTYIVFKYEKFAFNINGKESALSIPGSTIRAMFIVECPVARHLSQSGSGLFNPGIMNKCSVTMVKLKYCWVKQREIQIKQFMSKKKQEISVVL